MEPVVHVRHEEMNIRATMVLLQCQHAAGQIPLPLAVAMAPLSRQEDAWRAAAINHLNGHTYQMDAEKKKYANEQKWLEENERLDWEEERERRR
jgi:hypothetical protein